MRHLIRSLFGGLLLAAIVLPLFAQSCAAGEEQSPLKVSPWGMSSSASSFRNHEEWFPKMTDVGVSTIRLFPERRGFKPTSGIWHWVDGDRLVNSAARHNLEINAILMGSQPGTKTSHAFPMENLDGWAEYVSAVVGRYGKQIRYWEVWNEGNGGFNDGRHTTADYARLAAVTYVD
jgi:hypothetical protein